MKLNYEPLGIELEISEGEVTVLQIESDKGMREFMYSLWKQILGDDGDVSLYSDKPVSLSKSAELITNIFDRDVNTKKIISRVYKELEDLVKTELVKELSDLQSEYVSFLENLVEKSQYNLDYDIDVDVTDLFKLANIHFRMDSDTIIENLIEYLRLAHKICGINFFFIFHLRDFFCDEELRGIYEICSYEKISLILLESNTKKRLFDDERIVVIDKDLCII